MIIETTGGNDSTIYLDLQCFWELEPWSVSETDSVRQKWAGMFLLSVSQDKRNMKCLTAFELDMYKISKYGQVLKCFMHEPFLMYEWYKKRLSNPMRYIKFMELGLILFLRNVIFMSQVQLYLHI